MITDVLKEKISPVIGHKYVKLVNEKLTIANKKTYSQAFISNVYNGVYENEDIEDAILEIYQEKLAAKSNKAKTIKNILSKKNPEAVTSGNK